MSTDVLSIVWISLGSVLLLASLPGTVELMLLTLGGILPARRRRPEIGTAISSPPSVRRLAVVIPAHNEEAGIQPCVTSLRSCESPSEDFCVVVVADNCSDATAERAAEAGARMLVRKDLNRRGKGYALDYAFQILMAEGVEAFIVVDADTAADRNLVNEFRRFFAAGADAIQARYCVKNPAASIRTRLMNIALLAFNVLRPRGRDRWGWSAGILGNGFGVTRETLQAVPYDAHSVVEDLEYHLRLVRCGRRVHFANTTTVWGDMPTGGSGVNTQRARWEGGRLRMIADVAPGLLREVFAGRWKLCEPLLELLLLPLAFHLVLLIVTLCVPWLPGQIYASVGLCVVGLHVGAALVVGGGGMRDLIALLVAPFYVVWKLTMVRSLVGAAKKDTEWVRTDREVTEGGQP